MTPGPPRDSRLVARSAKLGAGSPWWGERPTGPAVLVVDDDRSLATVVTLVLRQYGFQVDAAYSGDDALHLLTSRRYDACVLDLRMPGKDGRAVFREMRAAGIATPVLILSAYDSRQARDELGAEAHLAKPFEPDRLAEAVQAMLTGGATTS
jgi:DNA-binding response OmpR family regulator